MQYQVQGNVHDDPSNTERGSAIGSVEFKICLYESDGYVSTGEQKVGACSVRFRRK